MIKKKKSFNFIRCCRKNENDTVNYGNNLSTDVQVSLPVVISLDLEKLWTLNLTTKTLTV